MSDDNKVPYFATVKKYSKKNLRKIPLDELLQIVNEVKDEVSPELQAQSMGDLGIDNLEIEMPGNNLQVDVFLRDLELQQAKLTQKIAALEKKQQRLQSANNLVMDLVETFSRFKADFNNFVRNLQDQVNLAEQKLMGVDPNQFLAQAPDGWRRFVCFLTRKVDEIGLNEKIARAETKIRQVETQLVRARSGLSTASLINKALEDSLKSLDKFIDFLRDTRTQLGKTSRSFQTRVQKQTNLDQHETIEQAYLENIQQLNKINSEYEIAVNENAQIHRELVQQLGQLQAIEIKRSSSVQQASVKQLPSQDFNLTQLEVDPDAQVDHDE